MGLTPDVLQMMRDRRAARVWLVTCGPGDVTDFDDLARRAGLERLGPYWVEVEAARAKQILVALLHKDLAYRSKVMTEHRAAWLANEFLGSFGKYDVRFATNTADMPDTFPFAWEPATEFTFDSGVAVMGDAGAGVYWIADED